MTASPMFLAQSEAVDWSLCPFRAHARYVAGYRPGREETMPQRVGSMGHAMLAEWARARFTSRPADPERAVAEEMQRRGWDGIDPDEFDQAHTAAQGVAEHVRLNRLRLVPDLMGGTMGPLADVVVRVPWPNVFAAFEQQGLSRTYLSDIDRCTAVRARYAGIEGHPDLVVMSPETDREDTMVIIDWKFRQHIDLGGADGEVMSEVPDRQFAWYATLLRAVGFAATGGVELWQVNGYAGRWLTVDDFVRVSQGGARDENEAAIVTEKKLLPTLDRKRYDKAGVAVTADVWAEAHRVLANARHAARLDEWERECAAMSASASRRKPPSRPALLTHTEHEDARRFIADLQEQQTVVVRRMRPDPVVCLEVVRDMLVGVEGPLRLLGAGLPPARHLQTWPRSACSRPGGCSVQPICLPTLGTFRGAEAAADRVAATRLPVYGADDGAMVE